MKVVLIYAPGLRPLEIYQSIGVRAPPLGLAYIAAVLEGLGHKVSIIDASTMGYTAKATFRKAISENPDVIGISSVTPTVKSGYLIAKYIKEYDSSIPVIMGGPHVSALYNEALSTGYVDYVVIGEGEITTSELINYLERGTPDRKKIKGLAYIDDSKIVFTGRREFIKNLDILPKPARHLLPMDKYTVFNKPIKIIHIMASRGCPYGCIYCSTSYYWGRRYRIRSAKLVVDEIEEAMEKYNTNIVVFSDDELTLSKRWVLEFSKEVRERGLDITYSCGSRVNNVDREILNALKKSGCSIIYYGIESYNNRDLKLIRKGITVEQAIRAIKLTKEIGIEVTGSFILGFPWQTIDDMRKTVEFASKLNLDYAQFTVATPYPGTPLFNLARIFRLIEIWDWDLYTTVQPVMRGFKFTIKQLGKMLSWAYRNFYLRPQYLIKQILKGRLETMTDIVVSALKSIFPKLFKRSTEDRGPEYRSEDIAEIENMLYKFRRNNLEVRDTRVASSQYTL